MILSKMLIVVDSSYWYYHTLFGALKEWQSKYPEDASHWVKEPKETDQSNLPDLTNCASFVKVLKLYVMKRLESVEYYSKQCFQNEIDTVDKIDIVFAMDSAIKAGFRKEIYPEYKLQRELAPKSFCNWKIRNYVFDVLFKELDVENQYGYKFIKVDNAEGDDVIATLFKKCSSDYQFKVLIASDHDFVQLQDVHQIDMMGREVKCELGGEKITNQEYLLSKIILGDVSDNIAKVFKGVGPKKCLKLLKDKSLLKKMLSEDQSAAKQFFINKKLISFDEIPEDLSKQIVEKINVAMYDNDVISECKFGNLNLL